MWQPINFIFNDMNSCALISFSSWLPTNGLLNQILNISGANHVFLLKTFVDDLKFFCPLKCYTGDFWNIKARSVGLNFCLQCLTPSIGRRPKLCKEMKSWCWGMDTRKSWRDDMLRHTHYLNWSSQNTNKTFDYRTNYTHTHTFSDKPSF